MYKQFKRNIVLALSSENSVAVIFSQMQNLFLQFYITVLSIYDY